MKILTIDSSITGENSVSRQLTAAIREHLKRNNKSATEIYRDVVMNPVPHQVGGFAGEIEYLSEFLAANVVIIGAPMYNFTIASQLKTWMDTLAVVGKTFVYGPDGIEGLAGPKRVIIASSRGGIYSPPSPAAKLDYHETYLRSVFDTLGVNEIDIIRAEGVALGEEYRHKAVESALKAVESL